LFADAPIREVGAVGVLLKYWLAGSNLAGRATGKRLGMSKAFIASVIQSSAEITGVAANRAAADLIEAIVKDLKKNGKFTLPSFGTFKAGKTVRFKASPSLKKLV
jgi:DNA-binding protein HU-beta